MLEVDTVAEKNYYVRQEVKMRILDARSKLQLVDDKTGQDGGKESKLTVAPTAEGSAAKWRSFVECRGGFWSSSPA
ncbi:hypothetical protein DR64_4964 [Paraburkholderia xenovorans LB400]|nr:hypothetical protein [Paraburkholderia xenovorans]AIP37364.1 hypothetical protein DR64_4964 [Paraburkholderia xenovorans LB400]